MDFLRILRSASDAGGGEATEASGAPAEQGKGESSSSESAAAGIKLPAEARDFLVKSGIDPEKASPEQMFEAVWKSRGELIQSEKKSRQEASATAKQLQSLEIKELLGVTELNEETKAKLHGIVAKASVFEQTVELLLEDGRIDDGLARILRSTDLNHAKDLIAVMPKVQAGPALNEEELFKKFRQQLGMGEDMGGRGSEGAGAGKPAGPISTADYVAQMKPKS